VSGPVLRAVRMAARRLALAGLRGAAAGLDHELVRSGIYSPIPSPASREAHHERAASFVGIELDLLAQIEFLEGTLAPYAAEFQGPESAVGEGRFDLWNGYYQGVDAELLYAILRHEKPSLVLEIGSGFSTLVAHAASERNAREGHPASLVAVDPEPRVALPATGDGLLTVDRRAAQALPLDAFLALGPGDVLFVDTSHTVKLGSEVNFIVLEVLPRLAPGVLVHFHDVFLPFEYPRRWIERGTYLTEQYLLHAFLVGNSSYRIMLALHALCQRWPERVSAVIPSLRAERENYPSAFWLVRNPDRTAEPS
jgi:hypothetical protein